MEEWLTAKTIFTPERFIDTNCCFSGIAKAPDSIRYVWLYLDGLKSQDGALVHTVSIHGPQGFPEIDLYRLQRVLEDDWRGGQKTFLQIMSTTVQQLRSRSTASFQAIPEHLLADVEQKVQERLIEVEKVLADKYKPGNAKDTVINLLSVSSIEPLYKVVTIEEQDGSVVDILDDILVAVGKHAALEELWRSLQEKIVVKHFYLVIEGSSGKRITIETRILENIFSDDQTMLALRQLYRTSKFIRRLIAKP